MIEQHTTVNLANYLEEVIARWNLSATHISAVVTDNHCCHSQVGVATS